MVELGFAVIITPAEKKIAFPTVRGLSWKMSLCH